MRLFCVLLSLLGASEIAFATECWPKRQTGSRVKTEFFTMKFKLSLKRQGKVWRFGLPHHLSDNTKKRLLRAGVLPAPIAAAKMKGLLRSDKRAEGQSAL